MGFIHLFLFYFMYMSCIHVQESALTRQPVYTENARLTGISAISLFQSRLLIAVGGVVCRFYYTCNNVLQKNTRLGSNSRLCRGHVHVPGLPVCRQCSADVDHSRARGFTYNKYTKFNTYMYSCFAHKQKCQNSCYTGVI